VRIALPVRPALLVKVDGLPVREDARKAADAKALRAKVVRVKAAAIGKEKAIAAKAGPKAVRAGTVALGDALAGDVSISRRISISKN
jgi:hypothetical protein